MLLIVDMENGITWLGRYEEQQRGVPFERRCVLTVLNARDRADFCEALAVK